MIKGKEMKWIVVTAVEKNGRTFVYLVATKETLIEIGRIRWYSGWRKYAFFPGPNTVFEPDCLIDIAAFLRELMADHRSNRPRIKEEF